MADETNTQNGAEGFPDAEKHNKEVAAKLAAQDINGKSNAPVDNLEAGSALDALAGQYGENGKLKDENKVVEASTEQKTPEELAKEAEVKEATERAAAERAEALKKADEFFKDSPTLAPNASPKSAEAFSSIKVKAAQEIAARETELEKLRKENAELLEKTKNAAPPETLKELEDHRQWRAKLDIEADPKFKSFDKEVASTHEFIYAQLRKAPGMNEEVIEAIKKHGGPEMVDMSKIFTALKDPTLQRIVESKVADIEQTKFNKAQAIEAAKKNVSEYVAERQKSAEVNATQHNVATEKSFSDLTSKTAFAWFSEKKPAAGATDAEKKSIEAHNAFVTETRKNLAAAMRDDTPEMRAIMLAGMGQLCYLQKVHDGTVSKLAETEKALKDVTEKYDKLRNGSVSRLRESNAPPGGKIEAVTKPSDQFTMSATEALDNLRKQVTEERARAEASGAR